MRRFGVVSDTHGRFDAALRVLFKGTEGILHAGDICGKGDEVIAALGQIAPVLAIVGNCDRPPLSRALPPHRVEEVAGLRVVIVHDLHAKPSQALIASERPDVVLSGHSHKPKAEVRDGALYLNPGSAGPKRFKLPRTAALLMVGARHVEARILLLEDPVGTVVAEAKLPLRRKA